MGAFLVTGNPGSGKTAMVEKLPRLGHAAVDTDDTISGWETGSGLSGRRAGAAHGRVAVVPSMGVEPSNVSSARSVRRVEGVEHVFLCGIANRPQC